MQLKRNIILLPAILVLLISGCGDVERGSVSTSAASAGLKAAEETAEGTEPKTTSEPKRDYKQNNKQKCPDAIIEWVDVLMNNDIKYVRNYEGTQEVKADQIGEKVGEVSYMLSDNACSDHITVNGDAAFLPVGTEIYELKGYRPEFRVVANHSIYEVSDNPQAQTVGNLLDIGGRISKVSIESGNDGSFIRYFAPEAAMVFEEELLGIKASDFKEIYAVTSRTKNEWQIFLRVHLQDGTSLRMVFYPEANAIHPGGFGTEKLKEIILSQKLAHGK
ncbi:hypothetical protein A8L34_16010 [Bacillus sp. FJAT-27264]|uniref:hypothetical protein n=1 Tax=Paenibacillus sp. (strain DSM 101736 / FJAT-27264) TaxID=1850362 RepID=UPI000808121C|nr:hypothetical protein [Bacillus sp. FJAT-27264]OBZ11831.1 hypothetical protein A8L34_16010 [Bacillus sp. FJAT-27264]